MRCLFKGGVFFIFLLKHAAFNQINKVFYSVETFAFLLFLYPAFYRFPFIMFRVYGDKTRVI